MNRRRLHRLVSESYPSHRLVSESYLSHRLVSESYPSHRLVSESYPSHRLVSESYPSHRLVSPRLTCAGSPRGTRVQAVFAALSVPGRRWGRLYSQLAGQTALYWDRPSTGTGPLLGQALYWDRPSTGTGPLLGQALYWDRFCSLLLKALYSCVCALVCRRGAGALRCALRLRAPAGPVLRRRDCVGAASRRGAAWLDVAPPSLESPARLRLAARSEAAPGRCRPAVAGVT
jgi:hypothetical protein